MIGSFLYSSRPRPDYVTIWLQQDGKIRSARVLLPTKLSAMMAEQGYPPPAPTMSVESALSYGIFLAIRSNAPLAVAGAREAWDPNWGYLTDLGQFPSAGLVAQRRF